MSATEMMRPIHAQIVWNSLSLISFRSTKTASAVERTAVTIAAGQPRIDSRGNTTGSSSHTRITPARIAA
jgi:hypothetical protein